MVKQKAEQRYFGVEDGKFVDKGHSLPLYEGGTVKSLGREVVTNLFGSLAGAGVPTLVFYKGIELLNQGQMPRLVDARGYMTNEGSLITIVMTVIVLAGGLGGVIGMGELQKRMRQRG